MPRLFVVAGVSGAGKTFLLKNALALKPDTISPVKKLTTRSPRGHEDEHIRKVLDLKFDIPTAEVMECEYNYRYAQERYGVRKDDIDQIIDSGLNPIVIIRDADTIWQLKEDYPDAIVIYLQIGLSGEDLRKKLAEQKQGDIEISDRMQRTRRDFDEYVKHLGRGLWDHVIINYFEPESLIDQLAAILTEPVDPDFVFVLMPFRPELDEVYAALQNAGKLVPGRNLRVERVDEKLGDFCITDEILKGIEKSALVIADLTYERPNVYYELGYARGLGKTVLHCAKEKTPIHFDIKDFNTIFYETPMQLQRKMTKQLQYHFEKHSHPF